MKKISYILLITITSIGNWSCKKFLDVDGDKYVPLKDSYYKSEAELRQATTGAYASLAAGAVYANILQGRAGLEVDEGCGVYYTDRNSIGLYVNTTSDTKFYNYYKELYVGINRANTVLSVIDNAAIEMSEEVRKQMKGEVLFLRAYYHFMLLVRFGDVPLILDAVPKELRAEYLQVARTPSEKVYAAIVKDLEEAGELLQPASTINVGTKVSQSAAWGMLARVNLQWAGEPLKNVARYAEAEKYAKKVIDLPYHILNNSYQSIFERLARDEFDAKEVIFEVDFYGNYTTELEKKTSGMVGRNNGIHNRNPVAAGHLAKTEGCIAVTNYLEGLYKTVPTDVRKNWNIAPYYYASSTNNGKTGWTPAVTTTTGAKVTFPTNDVNFPAYLKFPGKFRRESEPSRSVYDATYTPQNFPVLRLSDVYLMYAESLIMGNTGQASKYAEGVNYINLVRRRAIPATATGRDLPTVLPAGQDPLKVIMEERARELCFEGLRKNDLVRWGMFYSQAQLVKTDLENVSGTYTGASYRRGLNNDHWNSAKAYYNNIKERDVLWPIPAQELAINKKLVPNEGF